MPRSIRPLVEFAKQGLVLGVAAPGFPLDAVGADPRKRTQYGREAPLDGGAGRGEFLNKAVDAEVARGTLPPSQEENLLTPDSP